MNTFMCDECNTVGIVAVTTDGNLIVSPCDCVANTNNLVATENQ